jgi:hypothetical protein
MAGVDRPQRASSSWGARLDLSTERLISSARQRSLRSSHGPW